MTDEQIIKALECCIHDKCTECPYKTDQLCIENKSQSALDLINRQKVEIAEQMLKINQAKEDWESLSAIIEVQRAEIERFKEIETTINDFWSELQKITTFKKKSKPTLEELLEYMENLKAEVIKEFEKELRIEINKAIESNREAKRERVDRLIAKGVVCNDEFCSYCDGKIHALIGIADFVENLVKEMVGDTE